MRKGYRRRCKSLSRQSKMVQKRDGRAVVIARWELIGKTRLHTSVVDVIDLVGGVVFRRNEVRPCDEVKAVARDRSMRGEPALRVWLGTCLRA
jgi:hypothetical protein